MSRSGASSDLAKGKKFTKQLLYVQLVDKEKDTASTFSEQSLDEYFLKDSKTFSDSNFAEYLRNPKANVDILKSSLQDEKIIYADVCTNPLPAIPKTGVTIHAFVVFWTWNLKTNNWMFYSMEKNGQYIVLQQSPNEDDVIDKLYDPEEKKLVKRLGPVKRGSSAGGNEKYLKDLLRAIWNTKQLSTKYHLLFSNCQNFAEFVFEEASRGRMKWSTWITRRFGLSSKKSKIEIEAYRLAYNGRNVCTQIDEEKFAYYKAMAEERRQNFEDLAGNLTSESLNSVDSVGYTLLEWATVFSTSYWPIDQFLKEKGAETPADEGTFRRNVFSIALQCLPSNKESRYLSFDGIDIRGVNQTGDTALHSALYGEKWDVAERILDQFPDYDVNVTNSKGCTPLHLAVHPKCKMVLIKKILARMNSKSVNAQDEDGNTALHDAIYNQSEIAVKEMLKRKDVDVYLKNNLNETALHYASRWPNIPPDLFTKILEKWTDVNAQVEGGNFFALHLAITQKKITSVKELLKRDDVNLKDNDDRTALHYACLWKNIPRNLFRKILKKLADIINAQGKHGWTALHVAIGIGNRTVVEELLKRDDVNVNLKNNQNHTALHLACRWNDMPIDLFNILLQLSTDVNAQSKSVQSALHIAISEKNETAVKVLLYHKDVDVNLKDNENQTELHYACRWWKNIPIDLFRVILEKSTDVNAKDKHGWTALHVAIGIGNITVVEELLKRDDVNVNLKNNQNHTALHLACRWNDMPIDLFNILLQLSTDVNAQSKSVQSALHIAISEKNETAVKVLLYHKDVDVNLKDNENQTELHYACRWWGIPIDLFRVILEKTTDVVNVQNEDGDTALHLALWFESENAVKELLKHKDVDVNVKNNKNQTALFRAAGWEDMPIDLFRVILEKSANVVNAQDEDGHTALQWAIILKNRTAVEELLNHKDVDVNLKNNNNQTALNLCSEWKYIPANLLKIISDKTTAENEAT